ncbi:MAG: Ribonuclease P protein component [uncultured marine phage]|uniref:Ribonuclease P protein component n=1 Tax=uncultured marine phage TaxID=707152 RepID=A0A8D9CBR5_9VIRU|nr:MAG: Ribonuclease P protein component [uncultured marine phage]
MKNTLTHKKEISSLFDRGRTLVGKCVLIKYMDSDDPKYLVTTSIKKYKRAVDRNKIKRLLRESIKGLKLSKNIAIVYISNEIKSFDEISKDLNKLLSKL